MSFDKLQAPPFRELLWRGFFSENPVFRLALSLCPAVAVTNSVKNGLMMGLAVWAVQVLSSLTIAIFRNFIHDKVRIPIYTIVIAVWVTAMDMTLAALAPKIYSEIGLYIKLIASKFPLIPSVLDGFSMGLGFLFAMVLIGAIREVLGNGTIWGVTLIEVRPILFLVLPAGGFFTIGLLMAALNWVEKGRHV